MSFVAFSRAQKALQKFQNILTCSKCNQKDDLENRMELGSVCWNEHLLCKKCFDETSKKQSNVAGDQCSICNEPLEHPLLLQQIVEISDIAAEMRKHINEYNNEASKEETARKMNQSSTTARQVGTATRLIGGGGKGTKLRLRDVISFKEKKSNGNERVGESTMMKRKESANTTDVVVMEKRQAESSTVDKRKYPPMDIDDTAASTSKRHRPNVTEAFAIADGSEEECRRADFDDSDSDASSGEISFLSNMPPGYGVESAQIGSQISTQSTTGGIGESGSHGTRGGDQMNQSIEDFVSDTQLSMASQISTIEKVHLLTVLHLACKNGDYEEVAKLLNEDEDGPSDPNIADETGWTPLHEASARGHVNIVEALLKAGAVVDAVGDKFATPLHIAVIRRHVHVAEILVRYGANIGAKMATGETPSALAATLDDDIRSRFDAIFSNVLAEHSPKVAKLRRPNSIWISCSKLTREEERRLLESSSKPIQPADGTSPRFSYSLLTCFDAERTTHLVVPNSTPARSFKYMCGILTGKWIVSYEWFMALKQMGLEADEAMFEPTGSFVNPDAHGPKRARENFLMMKPSLFAGCIFIPFGKFTKDDLDISALTRLIELGKGKVISGVPETLETTMPYHADTSWKSPYVIITSNKRPKPVANIPCVSVSWLKECIDHFQLVPFPDGAYE